ncbi:MAG: rhodanese-like domain-containing protein [Acidiferrobacterales bacterium]
MSKEAVKTLSPTEAHNLVENDPRAVLIDVRSNMEFLFIGHPLGAINIAWIDEPDWKINEHFASDVRKLLLGGLSHLQNIGSAPVVLICRSGKRSLEAGELLIKEGFTDVCNVLEGFEGELDDKHQRSTTAGWRFDGLPWEQC